MLMDLTLDKGRYVLAVSGGVDSMVLLDILTKKSDIDLIVAHFDHGIRYDSIYDRQLVQSIAKEKGVKFIYDEGVLGPDASEAQAREARYKFLHKVRQASKASGIITAHHKDDLLETAIINLLRGTSRSGLASVTNDSMLIRPLLEISKSELVDYAKENGINWREDYTNQDIKYLRNYIRHKIIPKMSSDQKKELTEHIKKSQKLNSDIDDIITSVLHIQPTTKSIDRNWFISLPNVVSKEVMNTWLKKHNIKNIDKSTLQKLVIKAKTSQNNRELSLNSTTKLKISRDLLTIC